MKTKKGNKQIAIIDKFSSGNISNFPYILLNTFQRSIYITINNLNINPNKTLYQLKPVLLFK